MMLVAVLYWRYTIKLVQEMMLSYSTVHFTWYKSGNWRSLKSQIDNPEIKIADTLLLINSDKSVYKLLWNKHRYPRSLALTYAIFNFQYLSVEVHDLHKQNIWV